eukprot:8535330-Alexandrium_andersonii.AAC.1
MRPLACLVGGFSICARNGAERAPPELRGAMLRPFMGPCSSRFEHLTPCRLFRRCLNTQLLQSEVARALLSTSNH